MGIEYLHHQHQRRIWECYGLEMHKKTKRNPKGAGRPPFVLPQEIWEIHRKEYQLGIPIKRIARKYRYTYEVFFVHFKRWLKEKGELN